MRVEEEAAGNSSTEKLVANHMNSNSQNNNNESMIAGSLREEPTDSKEEAPMNNVTYLQNNHKQDLSMLNDKQRSNPSFFITSPNIYDSVAPPSVRNSPQKLIQQIV